MSGLTEEQVATWLADHDHILTLAIAEIKRLVDLFIVDWGGTYEFSVEQIENVRVKAPPRVFAKGQRKDLTEPGQLFERCHAKEDRERFPVHDLLGVRVLVLSLNQVTAFKSAVEALRADAEDNSYALGNVSDFDIEDLNEEPRAGGYRALHIDGSVTVRAQLTDYTVPFEVQVKTLAQHVYGQHTHDEAYVPDESNKDARYELVKSLQKALAEQLNGVDLLLAQLQHLTDRIRDEIAQHRAGVSIDAPSVMNSVRRQTGLMLNESEAGKLADQARESGLDLTADFAALIDPSGQRAEKFANEFEVGQHRRPTTRELIHGVVNDLLCAKRDEQEKTNLAAVVAEPPVQELDEMDPDAVAPHQDPAAEGKKGRH